MSRGQDIRYKSILEMNNKEMPILLLTGYLGSGKTTLVNRILSNKKGIRFAVIVNDIGEVNIDATLIQQGGVVGQSDDSLVALQNGCICCTLKTDLMNQIVEIMKMDKFDYIVIEASGICEPEPIAQTICSMKSIGGVYTEFGTPRLDCLVTVVDALRMADEFGCGESLERKNLEEDDIENLIIQQIEFCNVILLNKASEVSPEALDKIKHIIREIQTKAQIIECDYADVDLEKLLDTNMFDYRQTESGAGWIRGLESDVHEEKHEEHGHHHEEHEDHDHHEEHHHHHHDHDHEGGEVEEYGIGTFVYFRRPAFDLNKFDWFVSKKLPKSVIRAKGLCYFSDNTDMSCLFEQAGKQIMLREAGQWYATAPEEDLIRMMRQDPTIMKDWDAHYGDRMQKIVFIGQHMDKEQICKDLDECLVKE